MTNNKKRYKYKICGKCGERCGFEVGYDCINHIMYDQKKIGI